MNRRAGQDFFSLRAANYVQWTWLEGFESLFEFHNSRHMLYFWGFNGYAATSRGKMRRFDCYFQLIRKWKLLTNVGVAKMTLLIIIMIYNCKTLATTGLKKTHTQNRDLGNLQRWGLHMGGVQFEGRVRELE